MPGLDRFLNRKRPSIEAIKERVDQAKDKGEQDKENGKDGKEHDKEAARNGSKQAEKKQDEPAKTKTMAQRDKGTARPVSLSPSAISLFLECPRCFWLDRVKGVKRPSGPFPSLPNGMDRVLKHHFDLHRGDNTAPEELEGRFPGRLFQDAEKLRVWRNNYKGLRWTDPKTGITLMGAIDDLFVTDDGKHAPLDFKTRGYPRKGDTHTYYQHQMDLYSLLLEKNHMQPADFAILIFYHPTGVNATHDVIFDPDPVRVAVNRGRGEQLFHKAVGCLQEQEPPEPSNGCKWCRWNR